MAKFPVEINDEDGIIDAINNLLSGPGGLGQNFAGFSSYTPAWLTGNFRVPYALSSEAQLTVAPIALSQSEMLDGRTWKFTFATEQAKAPFALGNGIEVADSTDSFYNDTYSTIGVTECTTTYVIARTVNSYDVIAAAPGGTVALTTGSGDLSTDANARVTVTGGNDRVFISGQLLNTIGYTVASGPATLEYAVTINRYAGEPNNDPVNPDFVFTNKTKVSERVYTISGLTGTGTIDDKETIFTSILDVPNVGYYWYILEVKFNFTSGTAVVNTSKFGLRSLSVQVVKE